MTATTERLSLQPGTLHPCVCVGREQGGRISRWSRSPGLNKSFCFLFVFFFISLVFNHMGCELKAGFLRGYFPLNSVLSYRMPYFFFLIHRLSLKQSCRLLEYGRMYWMVFCPFQMHLSSSAKYRSQQNTFFTKPGWTGKDFLAHMFI